MQPEILRVKNVDVDLAKRRVLTDANLVANQGEMVSVIGANGAGKTTLIRAILGLVPHSGEILISGQLPAKAYKMVGYVPQRHEFAWDFPISVSNAVLSARSRQIGWFRMAKKHDYRAVKIALEKVKMSDLADRPVGELSGGQRQRVLLARALATYPKLLILDEPFTGIDMPTQEMLTEMFEELRAEGMTILMATHDLAQAMETSDKVALVNKTVVAYGTPDEVRNATVWSRTFGVSPTSTILRNAGVLVSEAIAC
ncbi:anchored repeat-type ABC transporter ATP-binding subunit [Propionimicrobium lymphophilum]|uniref:Anchored repeat-type ABC transporter, ATP-binding subunit n=1 Tax=Propionimicrobium lymphophilum ACS-093-V-SCH5 TaxID=883161 RepID=S2W0T7_9ACTN|nr:MULTISPECIES: anchored repeat-type ABC transporter ATP-binding subunit [Propionimicrobium]EPD31990.1 anchored repeat-type ABC transporter, ATP-binding subunit [Propionimicrobium lymphophilum ACS-093-V-SCH5]ETJ97970.1 anchored repeat-type ABC transporter, ATP-binding subunit [Propionimicrobium sp. BV2F7]MDK7710152.1 anchored repeat-type ABC transporter ATP-binding subunit [Propionimicrobium lymphophilum]MDK7734167.1 anchored repeat-type ABC transporter ATP-binding subunit [Propionimicrobium l